MHDPVATVVDTYLEAWNERDPVARDLLLAAAVVDDGEMAGPTGTFKGREAIAKLVAALQERMGEARIVRVGEIDDAALDGGRFAWQVVSTTGDVLFSGHDEVELAPDGRLSVIRVAL